MPAHFVNVRGTELLASDSRERYRQKLARITLDSMVQFVGLLDTRGTVLDINRVALDAVGIKLSDIEGKPFWTTLWWQVSEKTNRVLRESIVRASRGEFVRWDAEICGGAGGEETIIIDASLTPVKDEHGNVVFITVEGRDISERKVPDREIARQREEPAQLDRLRHEAAEKELQLTAQAESERQRLHDLLTAAQIGTWEWDPSGNIQLLSPELHRIFGTDATDPDYVQAWASCVYPD